MYYRGDELSCVPMYDRSATARSHPSQRLQVFTFVAMGGDSDKIRLVVFGESSRAKQTIRHGFRNFDVHEAKCFLEADTERLHGIIEQGFGGLSPFNNKVRGMFKDIADGRHELSDLQGNMFDPDDA